MLTPQLCLIIVSSHINVYEFVFQLLHERASTTFHLHVLCLIGGFTIQSSAQSLLNDTLVRTVDLILRIVLRSLIIGYC